MSLFEELADAGGTIASDTKPPKGWEPYAEEAGQVGSAIVRLPRPNVTKRDLLVSAGFNPDYWTIVGKINVRRWMRHDQEWLYYYKFDTAEGVETDEARAANIDELAAMIGEANAGKAQGPLRVRHPGDAWVYVASDWQIGKGEGDGTTGTVKRVLNSIEQAVDRIRDLRRLGHDMSTGVFAATGDLGEGTCGFYPSQVWETDCNRREQNRITRMLITTALDAFRPHFDELTVVTVGGNHGENRQDGKKFTDDADNDDVAQFECVKEAFDRTGGGDITWVIPQDDLSLNVDVAGVQLGFTHGHLFTSGGRLPQAKALEWWKNQDFGFQAVRQSQVLVSSHFHHFTASTIGARTHLQSPAMDPGSRWVTNLFGHHAPSGVLTMRVDPDEPLGWTDLQILPG